MHAKMMRDRLADAHGSVSLTAGLLILVAATPAQAVTAWHLRPVQRDPLLWVGSSQIGSAPDVALTVPSATGVRLSELGAAPGGGHASRSLGIACSSTPRAGA